MYGNLGSLRIASQDCHQAITCNMAVTRSTRDFWKISVAVAYRSANTMVEKCETSREDILDTFWYPPPSYGSEYGTKTFSECPFLQIDLTFKCRTL